MRFKTFVEATDIFGFSKKPDTEENNTDLDNKPLKQFDVELMMDYLSRKKVGINNSYAKFMNEIQWGERPGAIKLEVAPRMAFFVKKLAYDKLGQSRWVTKKMFQLNRNGCGGYEDAVATEIYHVIQQASEGGVPSAKENYDELERLTYCVADKMKKVAKPIFLYDGIKRLSPDNYLISFGVRAHGVEARDHMRIEEVLTQLSYDKEAGSIRVTNYKVASPVGGAHSWAVQPSDLDLYFFPTQDREEIAEAIAVHFKYY